MEDKVSENIDELKESSQIRSDILREIMQELSKNGISVFISDNDTILRIPEATFHFSTGSYEINAELRDTASEIGNVLYEAIVKNTRWKYLETVFVEGHSDSRDAPNYRMGNWE